MIISSRGPPCTPYRLVIFTIFATASFRVYTIGIIVAWRKQQHSVIFRNYDTDLTWLCLNIYPRVSAAVWRFKILYTGGEYVVSMVGTPVSRDDLMVESAYRVDPAPTTDTTAAICAESTLG